MAEPMKDAALKDRMSDGEEAGWDALLAELDRIPPAEMEAPGGGPGDWSAKDVVFHLAVWMDEAAAQLAAVREGRYEPRTIDTDARNAEYLRAGRALDVAAARVRLERAHGRLLAQWSALPELSAPAVEWFGEDGAEHYAEHVIDLRSFADRLGSTGRPGAADRRAAMLEAEREAWDEIGTVVADIPADGLERPGVTPDGWTVKDTMWHVAMWWQDFVDAVPRFADPAFDPDEETGEQVDEINRRWFEESRALPLDVVRQRWSEARDRGVAAFAAMSDPSRTAERWLEECGLTHYEKHLIDLAPWASNGGGLRGAAGEPH